MEKSSLNEYFYIIDGRYTLFHKRPSFLSFLCEILSSVNEKKLTIDEEFGKRLKSFYKTAKNHDLLEFLNGELLKNKDLNPNYARQITEQDIEIFLKKKMVYKNKILEDFFFVDENKSLIVIPISSILKESFYKRLLLLNYSSKLLDLCLFHKKMEKKLCDENLDLKNRKKVLISHKPKKFETYFSLNNEKDDIVLYFQNLFYNEKSKEICDEQIKTCNMEISLLNVAPLVVSFLSFTKENPHDRVIRVAYYFLAKKNEDMYTKQLVRFQFPFLFIPVDLRFPLKNQNYDIFIQKITDLIKYYDSDKTVEICMKNFKEFYDSNKEKLVFIDGPKFLDVVLSRVEFQNIFQKIFTNNQGFADNLKKNSLKYSVNVPKSICISKQTPFPKTQELFIKEGLAFPVILKTKEAAGPAKTHYMAIAVDFTGLQNVEEKGTFYEEDHLIQEFINHDEAIFKIYVIGDKTEFDTRQSMPNVNETILGGKSFTFDSQISFKDQLAFLKERQNNYKQKQVFIDPKLFDVMAQEINSQLGMSLYGFDLIKSCENEENIYIVDINYFPGFKIKGDLKRLFYEFLMKKLKGNN